MTNFIDMFEQETAEAAGFDLDAAREAGWTVQVPKGRDDQNRFVKALFQAEKWVPRTGTMQRLARRSEDELLEEIFQFERAEFETVRRADQQGRAEFKLMAAATADLLKAYLRQIGLVRAFLCLEPGDDRGLEIRREIRQSERRFRDAGQTALVHGFKFLEHVEREGGHPPAEIAVDREALTAARDSLLALPR